jgi:putative FmdB family regulatory protein
MPVYQYECTPCLVVYEVLHGMNDPPLKSCQKCGGSVRRLISAPRINRHNFSGPTEAKYAKVSPQQEVAKERDLQRSTSGSGCRRRSSTSPWIEMGAQIAPIIAAQP